MPPRKPPVLESPNTSSVLATEPPPPALLAAVFRLDLKGERWFGPDQINEHRGTGRAPETAFFRGQEEDSVWRACSLGLNGSERNDSGQD